MLVVLLERTLLEKVVQRLVYLLELLLFPYLLGLEILESSIRLVLVMVSHLKDLVVG